MAVLHVISPQFCERNATQKGFLARKSYLQVQQFDMTILLTHVDIR